MTFSCPSTRSYHDPIFYNPVNPCFLESLMKNNFKELKKLADQGNVEASYLLGDFYLEEGTNQNLIEAFHYLKFAADRGHLKAIMNVGISYSNGRGCEKDEESALKYYLLAADEGHPKAQFNVGVCYANAIGCEKNHEKAFEYFKKAAERNYKDAIFNLASYYLPGAPQEDPKKAFDCFKRAADLGQKEAQYNVAVLYLKGIGCHKDREQAIEYFKQSNDSTLFNFKVYNRYFNQENKE